MKIKFLHKLAVFLLLAGALSCAAAGPFMICNERPTYGANGVFDTTYVDLKSIDTSLIDLIKEKSGLRHLSDTLIVSRVAIFHLSIGTIDTTYCIKSDSVYIYGRGPNISNVKIIDNPPSSNPFMDLYNTVVFNWEIKELTKLLECSPDDGVGQFNAGDDRITRIIHRSDTICSWEEYNFREVFWWMYCDSLGKPINPVRWR